MHNRGIVRSSFTSEGTSLAGANELRKIRLDTVHSDLCDQLVNGVTKSNRPEFLRLEVSSFFWDKANEGLVDLLGNFAFFKHFSTKGYRFMSKNVQYFRYIKWWSPSGPGAFKGLKDLRAVVTSLSLKSVPMKLMSLVSALG